MIKIKVEKTASRGIAIAPAYVYREVNLTPDHYPVAEEKIPQEEKKFTDIKQAVLADLEQLSQENPIFAAHIAIADDYTLQEGIIGRIKSGKKNVQQAIRETVEEVAEIFGQMEDEYMRERKADVLDIGKRFLIKCKNITVQDLADICEPVIVVAKDLFPSDTVKMNPEFVKGIITEEGGVTSHVSIMAKNYGIPALTGVANVLGNLEDGKTVCMDAEDGTIVIEPEEAVLEDYRKRQEEDRKEQEEIKKYRSMETVTPAGKRIYLCINVGNTEEIKLALDKNIDGIGLFRTEFLYMENSHFPTEEEQFTVYREAAKLCPQEVTIRTLDIGGDKSLPYYEFEPEENPFLGWRAIRISLDMPDLFRTQLRAILRASAFGHIRIMFPMMISVEELQSAKEMVETCKEELRREQIAFDENIETGMMMETPASVLLAEEFAKEADFFSIGTNDLTQYILAVDRGNKKIASRYDSFHPAVMKAIAEIIRAGHKYNRKVGMCGELAGDVNAVPKLLELDLDEFSMSAGNVDYVRKTIIG